MPFDKIIRPSVGPIDRGHRRFIGLAGSSALRIILFICIIASLLITLCKL